MRETPLLCFLRLSSDHGWDSRIRPRGRGAGTSMGHVARVGQVSGSERGVMIDIDGGQSGICRGLFHDQARLRRGSHPDVARGEGLLPGRALLCRSRNDVRPAVEGQGRPLSGRGSGCRRSSTTIRKP